MTFKKIIEQIFFVVDFGLCVIHLKTLFTLFLIDDFEKRHTVLKFICLKNVHVYRRFNFF